MATNSLKFYKGSYVDFYNKFLTKEPTEQIDLNALYFTIPNTDKDYENLDPTLVEQLKKDVLSNSHGIWLGDKLISSSYVANDKGSLTNVELVYEKPLEDGTKKSGQFLKYTYILSNGTTTDKYVDVGNLLVDSEFKDGLKVSDSGEVSVKVQESTDDNKNFLTVDKNGLAVSGITVDCAVLEEEFTVVGTTVGGITDGTTFNKGDSIYTILQKMLTKEIYPTLSYTYASASTVTLSTPKVTISGETLGLKTYSAKTTESKLIPLGETLKINVTGSTVSENIKNNVISNLRHGYVKDGIKSNNTVISAQTYVTGMTNEGNICVVELSNYEGSSGKTTDNSAPVVSGISFQVSAVTSTTIDIKVSGYTIGYGCSTVGPINVISNIGNSANTASINEYYKDSYVPAKNNDDFVKFTVVRPCFVNTDGTNWLTDSKKMTKLFNTNNTWSNDNNSLNGKVVSNVSELIKFPSESLTDTTKTSEFYYPEELGTCTVYFYNSFNGKLEKDDVTFTVVDNNYSITLGGKTYKYIKLKVTGSSISTDPRYFAFQFQNSMK
jgi:hypothetical protein